MSIGRCLLGMTFGVFMASAPVSAAQLLVFGEKRKVAVERKNPLCRVAHDEREG